MHAAAPRWHTPDAAIRETYERPALRARAIDYEAPRTGTPESAQAAIEAQTQVLAILAQYTEEERQVVIRYAFGMSYRAIGKAMGFSDWKARQIHRTIWGPVRDRMVDLGLVEDDRDTASENGA